MKLKTVWKFPVTMLSDEISLAMPAGAEVVHVACQSGTLCIWALVDPRGVPAEHRFFVRGTGQPVEPHLKHVGTALMDGAFEGLVFHIFQEGAR